MAVLPLLRLGALSIVSLFSIIVLGLSAHLIYLTTTYFGAYFTYSAMSIATAVLSLATLPVMLVIDSMRKGAFTSMVVVELTWIGVLWVLWLTSAALSASGNSISFISGCNYFYDEVSGACKEGNAIEAFNFLNWLILMAYFITILVFALIGVNKGNTGVWKLSVSDIATTPMQSEKAGSAFAPGMMSTPQPTGGSYPPQQSGWAGQPTYHSQQSYPQV